ncbi:hypothetical protein BCR33DRAFT_781657 [Rhizoclosmatium globosum]|uniref:Pseudouridine synthase RsuA/RluA-like domain-containing protein n=1 Tax=Rhizoclosmatium globosum TaxID=329046 RepID=A0A1Y2CSM3_9FUNG|nr:hypothetical protein BCR33DRAFT_781657 [Rhizoclosmatium globosum]|eukprot:ORY49375.1 hypothetical protein BCR33DRAFT_781657 [Rhizoclosmatium globosum]
MSKREREEESPKPSRKTKSQRKSSALESSEFKEEASFVIDESTGLRRVEPYWHTYRINAKGRWFNRTLLNVFKEEFKDQNEDYYTRAILKGKISVNNESKDINYIIKSNDVVSHSVHRHEPPVTSQPIRFVFKSDDLLVVDKPGSIPVHPTGRYNHNTITGILKSKEYGFGNLYPVNRLDRLTSGILLLALTKEKASQLATELSDRNVSKTYLSRVRGKFPSENASNKSPPSIPGYPIANDPLYANPEFWGEDLGKGGVKDKEAVSEKIKAAKVKGVSIDGEDIADHSITKGGIPSSIAGVTLNMDEFPCARCAITLPDPTNSQLRIYLHSWKYSGESGWEYETPMPDWADPDFVE